MMNRSIVRLVAITASAAVMTSGCSSSPDSADSDNGETVSVTLGLIPITDVAPVYVGLKHGFFKAEGLDLKPSFAAGGAAVVPGVISGSIDIGYSNTVSLITAVEKGLPLEIIAPGSQVGSTQDEDHCFLYVKGSSSIRTPQDLAGKTIAVNTVSNLGDVSTRAALDTLGVDSSTVNFTEVPFPDMETALESDRVDATWPCEPFVTTAEDAEQRRILGTLVGTMPNLQFSGYFVSQQYAEEHADVVERFQKAMSKSLAYSQAHPDELREVTTEYAQVAPDVASRMILPVWSDTTVSEKSFDRLAGLSVTYGVISAKPDLADVINNGN